MLATVWSYNYSPIILQSQIVWRSWGCQSHFQYCMLKEMGGKITFGSNLLSLQFCSVLILLIFRWPIAYFLSTILLSKLCKNVLHIFVENGGESLWEPFWPELLRLSGTFLKQWGLDITSTNFIEKTYWPRWSYDVLITMKQIIVFSKKIHIFEVFLFFFRQKSSNWTIGKNPSFWSFQKLI
jgi:hypothetical protein